MSFKYGTCAKAASAGDLEELKKMHKAGCPWDEDTTRAAARNGHLDCLRYLHENGCPWDEWTPAIAAANGHLNCLRYVRENDCPLDERTALSASQSGELDCLQYAFEKTGGNYDQRIPSIAARNDQIDCFKYCFDVWYDPHVFCNENYQNFTILIEQIDLDDPVWRRLFLLNLSNQPELQTRVEAKKEEIKNLQKLLTEELVDNVIGPIGILPLDVITSCVFPYL